jgi:hypothetical protein
VTAERQTGVGPPRKGSAVRLAVALPATAPEPGNTLAPPPTWGRTGGPTTVRGPGPGLATAQPGGAPAAVTPHTTAPLGSNAAQGAATPQRTAPYGAGAAPPAVTAHSAVPHGATQAAATPLGAAPYGAGAAPPAVTAHGASPVAVTPGTAPAVAQHSAASVAVTPHGAAPAAAGEGAGEEASGAVTAAAAPEGVVAAAGEGAPPSGVDDTRPPTDRPRAPMLAAAAIAGAVLVAVPFLMAGSGSQHAGPAPSSPPPAETVMQGNGADPSPGVFTPSTPPR